MVQAGQNADLRVSDAERDAVVTELGEHFQAGRLDQAEFDERLSAAMTAKTRRQLDALLTDLPGPHQANGWPDPDSWSAGARSPGSGPTGGGLADHAPFTGPLARSSGHRHAPLVLIPLVIAIVIAANLLGGSWHEHWYLFLVLPALAIRVLLMGGRRIGGGRGSGGFFDR
jgi:hypothetical protein